tara:strand:- start:179 stop:976 length:798 start_codon:yes stop_codon:yes gene_type:complete
VRRYHGWSYNLDGALAHAPDADGEAGFCKDDLSLRRVAVDQWGAAIFIHPDPQAACMRETYPTLFETADEIAFDPDPAEWIPYKEVVYDIPTNWKLWYDNGTVCYHCPTIHESSFADSYDSGEGSYSSEMGPGYLMSHYLNKPGDRRNAPIETEQYAFQVFPGFVCIGEGDILHMTGMVPISAGRTHHVTHWLARPGTDPDYSRTLSDVWDQTYREDNAATSDQYNNLAVGHQDWNRYVAGREFGAVHMSRTIWDHYKAALSPVH